MLEIKSAKLKGGQIVVGQIYEQQQGCDHRGLTELMIQQTKDGNSSAR